MDPPAVISVATTPAVQPSVTSGVQTVWTPGGAEEALELAAIAASERVERERYICYKF